ncbi:MAG: VCBS repeat-containing protein [Vicinamibacterales bacterium]
MLPDTPSRRSGSVRRPASAIIVVIAGLALAGSGAPRGGLVAGGQGAALPTRLWVDATAETIGETGYWTNKVEVADINGDGRPDLLFANGGNYSEPGTPEPNQVFINNGPGRRFTERTSEVFGPTPDIARVIKARDLDADGLTDIVVGTTYETQSRLYLGTGGGAFREVTATHLPQAPASIGDLEVGDVDGDGDLDLVLADWGPGNNMTNAGGRTRLWLNDGTAHFTEATAARMPDVLVRFSWELELTDVDNDTDLDVVISCKRCGGSLLFRNDGTGTFADDSRFMPQYTNNYEFEPMDLDGDGFLDLVTINDGEILDEQSSNRREHVFRNDGRGRFRDATTRWWPPEANAGYDDNMVAFLDYDSDGDADFVIGSLSGPDRLLINDGKGHLTLAPDVFVGPDTPGTLGLALADLDGDGRMDAVQAQGENPRATGEKVFLGTGLAKDTAPPVVQLLTPVADVVRTRTVIARIHDRKSPLLAGELHDVTIRWGNAAPVPMRWVGEYLWRAVAPASVTQPDQPIQICASDAAGNRACRGTGLFSTETP